MASLSQENLYCPVCREIFQDPVLLSCSHSLCRACLQQWWTANTNQQCPVCRTRALESDPPGNLALKNLCEAFLLERAVGRCSLHSEELKLFCLTDEQPVCVVCLHSEIHKYHSIKPIDEAVRDNKEGLQELLDSLQNKLALFNDMKENLDQTAKDIEDEAEDTEKQIKDVFAKLRRIFQEEEQARTAALREEKQQKTEMMRTKSEALNKEIEALSDTIRGTNEVLRAEDLSFLQKYNTAAELVHCLLMNDPQPVSEATIDVDKHLNNLPFNILDRMKMTVTHTLNQRTADPEPMVPLEDYLSRLAF